MAERDRMQWGGRAIVAACGVVWAVGAACGGSGGGATTVSSPAVFPQGHLPAVIAVAGDSGDVAFRSEGDLYAVAGGADVMAVSRSDGSVAVFSADVGGAGSELVSIAVGSGGILFVGDADGIVYRIDAAGMASELIDTGSGPITGLAFAPSGFGDLEGSLMAAAGAAGLRRITTGATPTVEDFEPLGSYVDLVFSGQTLFALDRDAGEIFRVAASGTPTSIQAGFDTPVGLGLDPTRERLLVADAGDATLYAVPLAGGSREALAPYVYGVDPPSGIAYDGAGTLAWVASGSVVLHGSALPRVDTENPNFGARIGGTSGFGDLEFARNGSFLLVVNDPDHPDVAGDSVGNFLLEISRDHASLAILSQDVGATGELLLSLAYDPSTLTIYVGTDAGNVFRRTPDGTLQLLVAASPDALLGLEIAPAGFGAFAGHLVATTDAGGVIAIDPEAPVPVDVVPAPILTTNGLPAPLSDLVFSLDAMLYVVDHGTPPPDPGVPRVLIVEPDGSVAVLAASLVQLSQADGIEIDEGGERLFVVTSDEVNGDQLVEVSRIDGSVTPLVDLVDLDSGFFPTGVVYDRLGTAVVRQQDDFTALGAFDVF